MMTFTFVDLIYGYIRYFFFFWFPLHWGFRLPCCLFGNKLRLHSDVCSDVSEVIGVHLLSGSARVYTFLDPGGKWTPSPAVLVQRATHWAAHQSCAALQGKEWETDGSTENWELEVGQDVLKGDKQWIGKVQKNYIFSQFSNLLDSGMLGLELLGSDYVSSEDT